MKQHIDGEALLRAFFRREIAAEAERRGSRTRKSVAPKASGRAPEAFGEREGLVRACLAAAACLALLVCSGALVRPIYAETRGLFIVAEAFGELLEWGGILEPFKDMPQAHAVDGGT